MHDETKDCCNYMFLRTNQVILRVRDLYVSMDMNSGDRRDLEASIPEQKNPYVSKNHVDSLFGFLQVEATTHHDSIQELKEIRHELLSNIPEEGMADKEPNLNDTTKETLRDIMDLDPRRVDSKDDLPPNIQNSPVVTLEAVQPSIDLSEIIIKIQDQFEEMQGSVGGSSSEILLPNRKSRQYLNYFTISSAVIEHRSAFLLKEFLIIEEFREDESVSEFIEERMSQSRREELLYGCGVVGGTLLNKMQKVRGKRNSLVHQPHERRYIKPERFLRITDMAFQVADKLDEKLIGLLDKRYEDR